MAVLASDGCILGDPGAVSGGKGKSKLGREKLERQRGTPRAEA